MHLLVEIATGRLIVMGYQTTAETDMSTGPHAFLVVERIIVKSREVKVYRVCLTGPGMLLPWTGSPTPREYDVVVEEHVCKRRAASCTGPTRTHHESLTQQGGASRNLEVCTQKRVYAEYFRVPQAPALPLPQASTNRRFTGEFPLAP